LLEKPAGLFATTPRVRASDLTNQPLQQKLALVPSIDPWIYGIQLIRFKRLSLRVGLDFILKQALSIAVTIGVFALT
jgi:hypothetical protein